MRTALMLASLALLAASSPASAKKRPPLLLSQPTISASPIALMIAGFDRDGDAVVTRTEYDAGVARSFANGDANADGRITLIELSAWSLKWLGHAGALPGQFDFDRDGDDAVSRAEYAAEFDRRLAGFDKDRDGNLFRAELISLTGQLPLPPRPAQAPPPK